MAELNTITPTQLMRRLGTADMPAILDVRIDEDIAAHPFLIPTALPYVHGNAPALPDHLIGRDIVVVCHKGLKLSLGVAALLRAKGVRAEILKGGFLAWKEAGLPVTQQSSLQRNNAPGSRWVTRHRPKIDRIACPWLIRRFIDPTATFMFVPPDAVRDVAERFDALPFDIEGIEFSHQGERCTFDALVAEFGLSHPALDHLAQVVRAADTNRHDLAPQAAGLLALSVGLSRLHKDDHVQLDAAMPLYDALYRWARDGRDEGHDWPAKGTS